MTTREGTMIFLDPFHLESADRTLPAGTYKIVSEEELIEGLSFPVYRRVSTFIIAPAEPPYQTSLEMIAIAPSDLAEVQRIGAAALKPGGDCKP